MCIRDRYRGNPNPLHDIHPGPSYVVDLLNRGLRLGFIGGTDSHATMPSGRGVESDAHDRLPGLTAVFADGLSRDERIYNIFDTTTLLRRPPQVAITDKSGADGVALWVNNRLGLKGKERLSKIKLHKICRYVADQYENGRTTAISEEEMLEQIRIHLPDLYEERIKPTLHPGG